jgi:nitroreductase
MTRNGHQDTAPQDTAPLYEYQEGMPWNPVEKVIMERRSIRAFKKDPLPDSMIRRILEAGRFAPSAANAQPWKFVVVKDPEIIAAMERDTVKITKLLMWFLDYSRNWFRRILLAPLVKLIIRVMPTQLHPVPFTLLQQIAAEKVPVYHKPSTIILILTDRRGVGLPALDTGICGQNMVLSAHSLGAGTCWVGMIAVLMKSRKWRKKLGVKYPYRLTDCLALGLPRQAYDGEVERELQLVDWIEPGQNGQPRVERQGD